MRTARVRPPQSPIEKLQSLLASATDAVWQMQRNKVIDGSPSSSRSGSRPRVSFDDRVLASGDGVALVAGGGPRAEPSAEQAVQGTIAGNDLR